MLSLLANLVFQHSLLWLIPALVLAVAAVWLLYKSSSFSSGQKWILGSLRVCLLLILALLLLKPMLKQNFSELEKPILLWATDVSASIKESNSFYEETLENQHKLEEKYQVIPINFANGVQVGNTIDTQYTNLAGSLQQIQSNYYKQNVAACVLLSDGIYNLGADPSFQAKNSNFPVFTVGLGDSVAYPDIKIAQLKANDEAYLQNEFAINIAVEANDLAGKSTLLTLVDNHGKNLLRKELSLVKNKEYKTLEVFIKAEKAGLQRYTATVSSFDQEKNKQNNSSSVSINVTNTQKQVAVVARGPHPDIFAIKAALSKGNRFDVRTYLQNDMLPNLADVDLIVLHDPSNSQLNWAVSSKKAIWLFNGPQTDQTLFTTISGTGGGKQFEQTEVYVDDNFSLFDVPEDLESLVNEASPLFSPFGKLSSPQPSKPLMLKKLRSVKSTEPIWYFFTEQHKKCIVQGVNIWRWRLYDFQKQGNYNRFDALITATANYLCTAPVDSRFVVNHKSLYRQGDQIKLTATVLNPANELSNKATVTIELTNGEDKKYTYTFAQQDKGYELVLEGLESGVYNFSAKAVLANEVFNKYGSFEVKNIQVEQNDLKARFGLLRNLSSVSQGAFYQSQNLTDLTNNLLQSNLAKPIASIKTETKPLVKFKWLFLLLFTLAGLEWGLRKYFGKY